MTKGITGKEPDPRIVYADIIDLPHWQSVKHPHMSLYDRAAQFSAYKALTGYEDMVNEEARLTEDEIELGESELDILNQKITRLTELTLSGRHPSVTFTVFIPDSQKSGGRYTTITDMVKSVDTTGRCIHLMTRSPRTHTSQSIDFDRIIDIRSDHLDPPDIM
ncbi:MAG: hypothetical protein IJ242_01295 [Clostridia bacterium]|nr:hypothetical protein [Clostridia bacterium]